MERIVLKTIEKFNLLQNGDKIVVAVSAGPDSTALWHFLSQLKTKLGLQLHLAHLDHSLRGEESRKDAEFVRQLAQVSQEPFTIENQDIAAHAQKNKLSIQEAARQLRYNFLNQVAKKCGAGKIAVGHNADDQAETVLLRLLRGSGPEGLRAIQPQKEKIIRPLLETTRKQIMDFIKQNNIKYRQDSSNLKTKYLRNKLRRELIPALVKNYNPNIKQNLVQLADILREEEVFWDNYLPARLNEIAVSQDYQRIVLNTKSLSEKPLAIQRRLCRLAIGRIQGNLQAVSFTHIQQILQLINKTTGEKQLHLPHGIKVVKGYHELEISGELPQPVAMKGLYPLKVPGVTRIKAFPITIEADILPANEVNFEEILAAENDRSNIAWMDWDNITHPLNIRYRRPGDRFTPLGMKKSKKLKDFFIDNKVPRGKRENVPLLVGGNEIIWVMGIRISNKIKVAAGTKNIVRFRVGRPET